MIENLRVYKTIRAFEEYNLCTFKGVIVATPLTHYVSLSFLCVQRKSFVKKCANDPFGLLPDRERSKVLFSGVCSMAVKIQPKDKKNQQIYKVLQGKNNLNQANALLIV